VSDVDAWQGWLDAIREIVRAAGAKEAAFRLDLSGSELSNALAERNRCSIKAAHLPTLLSLRSTDELPRLIASHCGLELAAPRPMTAAERLERLEQALLRAGTAGQAILADAYGRRAA
jgi:hypothetical protein